MRARSTLDWSQSKIVLVQLTFYKGLGPIRYVATSGFPTIVFVRK